jgi:hypothetical protein
MRRGLGLALIWAYTLIWWLIPHPFGFWLIVCCAYGHSALKRSNDLIGVSLQAERLSDGRAERLR